ncbi:MAG: hypothetical protein K0Q51_244 [Rickettsiaceae bacterium]|jgi:hypothetical protein|nr:hypothetical protein [Rickettsiaceae bacterium]
MQDTYINYTKLIDEAMHIVVKRTLETVADNGIPGDHHFYISFLTQAPGVALSSKLKQRYPEEMTIVLQYQFEDLRVFNDYFSVKLSFEGVKETIVIPFNALTAFADPSVKFGLQFKYFDITSEQNKIQLAPKGSSLSPVQNEELENADNIVSLDSFRNKHKKK